MMEQTAKAQEGHESSPELLIVEDIAVHVVQSHHPDNTVLSVFCCPVLHSVVVKFFSESPDIDWTVLVELSGDVDVVFTIWNWAVTIITI